MRQRILKFSLALLFMCSANLHFAQAQLLKGEKPATRADSLRGSLSPLRNAYDINFYHLDIHIDIDQKSVIGSNEFRFTAKSNFNKLQFDLFDNLKVDKVLYQNQELKFTREAHAVFVEFPKTIKKGARDRFTVYYSGQPRVAKNAPWDGGFIFKKDSAGNPFVSVACQGLGASVWYPNKDHQSDEVDSMRISISSSYKDLDIIANGRSAGTETLQNGAVKHHWFVSNPINNYNVAFYIGKYAHWTDSYTGEKGPLSIDYYALQVDSAKARPHWEADVKPMLKCFEHWFGPYPFYEDGFKLVQAPHLGMEHQSAVAYGNAFRKGYLGRDMSGSGVGLKWDFIIIHESAHEWFGNNITSKDIADMWVHEGFTNYSETLFSECQGGKEAGNAYIQGIRRTIANDRPIIGKYGINQEGSSDMYNKGGNMVHTIRQLIDNDEKFRALLRGLNETFYHQTVTTQQVENYIIKKTGLKLQKVFDQYLRHAKIPVLEYEIQNGVLKYRWQADVKDFDMPVKVQVAAGSYQWLKPQQKWQQIKLQHLTAEHFKVDPNFYIQTKSL